MIDLDSRALAVDRFRGSGQAIAGMSKVKVGGADRVRRSRPPSASARLRAKARPIPYPAALGEHRVNNSASRSVEGRPLVGRIVYGERAGGIESSKAHSSGTVLCGVVKQDGQNLSHRSE